MSKMINKVLVVGAGVMGSGIAQVLMKANLHVNLCDFSSVLMNARQNLSKDDLISFLDVDRLTKEAASEVDLIIEAISEKFQSKTELICKLDSMAPAHVIISSNTSTFSIASLSEHLCRKERFLGMHFFNPPSKMKLVEVIKGKETSAETLNKSVEFCSLINKTPIVIPDSPGFVVNRLLFALLNEAFNYTYKEKVDYQVVDKAMKLGAAMPLGPFALADLIGLDVCYSILSSLARALSDNKYFPCPMLAEKIQAGEIGRKSGKGFYEYQK